MTITIATYPLVTELTLLATVKTELGISGGGDDIFLNTLIDQASGMVETMTNRPMYRAQFTERLLGSQTTRMVLSRLPVVSLDSLTYDGAAMTITNYLIESAEAGFVFCENGFSTTGSPLEYVFTYTAGYLLPGNDISATTISAASADNSYTDSADGFPLLVAGDTILVSGFTNAAANDGRKTVVSATPSKIFVEEDLTMEGSGNIIVMTMRNLPTVVERAAIDLVKAAYQARKRDPALGSLRVGAVESRWGGKETLNAVRSQLGKYRVEMRG